MNRNPKVFIMGAGPAELSAGYVLTQQNVDSIVCEKADLVGGLARTVRKGEFLFDIGGHRFFTENDEIHRFVMDLMGDEVIKVKRKSRILFRGKYIDYPLNFISSLLGVGIPDCFKFSFDYIAIKMLNRFSEKKTISFEDYIVSQFGRKLFDLFFKVYTEKIWGIPCNQISSDWAGQRIQGMSLKTALENALFRWRKNSPKSLVHEFHYFKQGYGRISEKLASDMQRANKVYLKTGVVQAQHEGKRIKAAIVNKDDRGLMIHADHFISGIPITELVQMMTPSAPDEVVEASKKLRYRDLITVHLMLNRQQVTPNHWIYIHDRDIGFARIHEPKNWSIEMAPFGKTSLVIEYFCNQGDSIWSKSNENLVDLTIQDLSEKLGLINRREILDGFVLRHPKAYPVYDVGYEKHLHRIYQFLDGFKNLHIVGRCGMFRYNNTDHAIETGVKAARHILGAHDAPGQINLEKEYLEKK